MPGPVFVILFASRPGVDLDDWKKRFERYAAAAGRDVRVLTASPANARVWDALAESDRPAVLWDAGAGMPPKELESLIRDMRPDEWRVGVRYSAAVGARGVGRWSRAIGWFRGRVCAVLGRVSDPCPPCVAASCTAIRRGSAAWSSEAEGNWVCASIDRARRERARLVEVPVMWAAV